MRENVFLLLVICLFCACSNKDNRNKKFTEANNLQIYVNEITVECNKPHAIGNEIIPYFPYEMTLKLVVKNLSNDTILFGSSNRFSFQHNKENEISNKYGLFILKDSVDSIVFNSRLDDIQVLAKNDSIEITVDYSKSDFFNSLPIHGFQQALYEKVKNGFFYYLPHKEDYKNTFTQTTLIPTETVITMPQNIGIFFIAQGKYLSYYP